MSPSTYLLSYSYDGFQLCEVFTYMFSVGSPGSLSEKKKEKQKQFLMKIHRNFANSGISEFLYPITLQTEIAVNNCLFDFGVQR